MRTAGGPIANAGLRSLAVQIAAIVLGFGQAVISARLLGAADYGILAAAAAVSAILAVIAVGGFDQYAVRELSRLRADGDQRTTLAFLRFSNRSALAASLLAGGGLAAVGFLTYSGTETSWRYTLILAGALTPLTAMLMLSAGQLRGLGAVVFSQLPAAVIRPCAIMLTMGALWAIGLRIEAPQGMIALLLASFLAVLVATAGLCRFAAMLIATGPSEVPVRAWLIGTAPFLGSTVVAILSAQVNTLMLAALAGPEAAGLFQPIAFLVPLVALPLTALSMPFAPHIVELWQRGDQTSLRRTSLAFSSSTFLSASAIGIAALLFGEQVLAVFGPEFVAAAPALAWVVAAQIIFVALGPAALLLSMTGVHRIVLAAQVLGLVLNAALAAVLIPAYGVEGAAMALTAGIVVAKFIALPFAVRRFGFDPSIVGACWAAMQRS